VTDLLREVIRTLARQEKKVLKRGVIDVVEASSTPEEFKWFLQYLKDHNVDIVEEERWVL